MRILLKYIQFLQFKFFFYFQNYYQVILRNERNIKLFVHKCISKIVWKCIYIYIKYKEEKIISVHTWGFLNHPGIIFKKFNVETLMLIIIMTVNEFIEWIYISQYIHNILYTSCRFRSIMKKSPNSTVAV